MEITKDMIMSILRSQLDISFKLFKKQAGAKHWKRLEVAMYAYQHAQQKDISYLSRLLDDLPISRWIIAIVQEIDMVQLREKRGSP